MCKKNFNKRNNGQKLRKCSIYQVYLVSILYMVINYTCQKTISLSHQVILPTWYAKTMKHFLHLYLLSNYSIRPIFRVSVEFDTSFKKCKGKLMEKDSVMWTLFFYISFIIKCEWKKGQWNVGSNTIQWNVEYSKNGKPELLKWDGGSIIFVEETIS